jgi:hypothetical protein
VRGCRAQSQRRDAVRAKVSNADKLPKKRHRCRKIVADIDRPANAHTIRVGIERFRRTGVKPFCEPLGTTTKFYYGFSIPRLQLSEGRALVLGAKMTRLFRALAVIVLAGSFFSMPALTETQLNESPITPGFWSFPTKKTVAAPDIVALCRNHFEIRFADGHFIGLRMQKRDGGLVQREVEKVGRCTFDRGTQTDRCEMRLTHSDGSILAGAAETKYSFDGQKILKMVVTPKMITDSPVDNAPFDAFPVRCPDDAVWNILNESTLPK